MSFVSKPNDGDDSYFTARQRQSYNNIEGAKQLALAFVPLGIVSLLVWCCHESIYETPTLSTVADRLQYTLRLQLFPALVLQCSILYVIFQRAIHPRARNPIAGFEFYVELSKRILQNTLEQFALFEVAVFISSLVFEQAYLFLLPYAVFCWTLGRITFAIGYLVQPKYRIFGFVWTMTPTVCMLSISSLKYCGFDVLQAIDSLF